MALSWDERHQTTYEIFVPWIEQVKPLKGARVLEFGSGRGGTALAWARAGAKVTGVDIEINDTEEAKEHAARTGLDAVFVGGDFEYLKTVVRQLQGEIDVFMLYAVLEHMTPLERIDTLELARDCLAADGIVVVVESPNRNQWFDAHTTTMPFFDQLPDALAFRLAHSVAREEIKDNLFMAAELPAEQAETWRYRLGRGVSHHEFEYVFGDLAPITMHCNWEPSMLEGTQGVSREQIALSRFMDRNCPTVPPSFSRYYIDLIIKPSGGKPYPYVRPLPLSTEGSTGAVYTKSDMINVSPGGKLLIELPHDCRCIVLGITVSPAMTEQGVRFSVSSKQSFVEHETRRYDANNSSWISYVEIPVVANKFVTVDAVDFLEVSFVGYRPK